MTLRTTALTQLAGGMGALLILASVTGPVGCGGDDATTDTAGSVGATGTADAAATSSGVGGAGGAGATGTGGSAAATGGSGPGGCSDGVKNGDESDVDCGGSCPPCANGKDCNGPSDCQAGTCQGGVCGGSSCSDGVQNGDETGPDCGGSCGNVCVTGSCQVGAEGAGNNCGLNKDQDCCEIYDVPGGTFNRLNDPQYPATVAPFKLGRYEVTVGRFRQFLEANQGTQLNPPASGDGANPNAPNTGWDPSWNSSLTTTKSSFSSKLKCEPSIPIWTSTPGANEERPICCETWYEAQAFCIWEGGRLPTEAEWNFASAGGSIQNTFPWGNMPASSTLASFNCTGDGSPSNQCTINDFLPVGSKPAGDTMWGHADMAGNAWEYVFDTYANTLPKPCDNCVQLGTGDVAARGGSALHQQNWLNNNARTKIERNFRVHCAYAFRCAFP